MMNVGRPAWRLQFSFVSGIYITFAAPVLTTTGMHEMNFQ